MSIRVYSPEEQAVGEFDGGTILEQKPIGFPGEGSVVKRVGTLFYWAWFKSLHGGKLPLHPHRGFEIISYVLEGSINHQDTLGRESLVGAGGAQVMQTGRGVSHAEHFGAKVSGFQIWFEPFFGDALKRVPTYSQYEHSDFQTETISGATVKKIIGPGSPIQLVADAQMWDVTLPAGQSLPFELPSGYSMAGLVVEGDAAQWTLGADTAEVLFAHFAVADAVEAGTLQIQGGAAGSTRLILIQVPSELGYLPYNKVKVQL
ncbi:pirin family protein [Paenibacillus cremeus]|uniref:Pirin family protein n=1 Tax=Paenibacillus cremeus TaxID=2163881 RepID=A0A559K6H3_9BACL|nr:pirin family protein [Paenibacillus cremeus]TVY07693.1 pirin family protein [Paenibacillus cremeus]